MNFVADHLNRELLSCVLSYDSLPLRWKFRSSNYLIQTNHKTALKFQLVSYFMIGWNSFRRLKITSHWLSGRLLHKSTHMHNEEVLGIRHLTKKKSEKENIHLVVQYDKKKYNLIYIVHLVTFPSHVCCTYLQLVCPYFCYYSFIEKGGGDYNQLQCNTLSLSKYVLRYKVAKVALLRCWTRSVYSVL